jgi:glycosyltransferase involved in cell wall biosynthesis
MPRIALALFRGAAAFERPRDPTGETGPRVNVFDGKFSPVWDERSIDRTRGWRWTPDWFRLAQEVQRRSSEYDAVVTWNERLSLALMALQRLERNPKPHIAMMYWFEKPNIQIPMRLFGSSLHALVTWSSVQRRFAIEQLGFPAERCYFVRHFVDQLFFRPQDLEEDLICAAGSEMRDYPTLLEAVRGTDLRCHIASDHVRLPGRVRLSANRRVPIETYRPLAGPHVTFGRKGLLELRELYARSRFVVVPLVASNSDNGVSVILEAMAMGKPVICSRTRGQVDVIEDGVNGLLVPVGDPQALRQAILGLWNDPDRRRAMGAKARAHVERLHTLEQFSDSVRKAVEAALEGQDAAGRVRRGPDLTEVPEEPAQSRGDGPRQGWGERRHRQTERA